MAITWTPPGEGPSLTPSATTTPLPVAPQRAKAGMLLVEVYTYLARNAEEHPALAPVIPVLSSAVASYRATTQSDPFAGVRQVVRRIQEVRATDPSIPDS